VRLGIAIPFSEQSMSPAEAARAVEARGFESLWVGEHSHLPVATVHRYTTGRYGSGATAREGRVPDMYRRFFDPFVVLAGAAAATTTVRVGTAVCIAAERGVLHLAKEVATLDLLSQGRFELGVGYGWNALEARNNGVEPARRRDVLREKIEAMKLLWTEETAGYSGEFVRFEESWSQPKPVQRPHPPVLLGAGPSPRAFADIVEWADGWMPVKAMAGGDLAGSVIRLRRVAEEAGRDPATVGVTLIDPEASFAGKRDLARFDAALPDDATVESWPELGVDRLVVRVPADDRDLFLGCLDVVAGRRERWPVSPAPGSPV
jgi:probable F420-dependent oxidoreductase